MPIGIESHKRSELAMSSLEFQGLQRTVYYQCRLDRVGSRDATCQNARVIEIGIWNRAMLSVESSAGIVVGLRKGVAGRLPVGNGANVSLRAALLYYTNSVTPTVLHQQCNGDRIGRSSHANSELRSPRQQSGDGAATSRKKPSARPQIRRSGALFGNRPERCKTGPRCLDHIRSCISGPYCHDGVHEAPLLLLTFDEIQYLESLHSLRRA